MNGLLVSDSGVNRLLPILAADISPGGAKGTRTPDPLLAKYASAVGDHGWPGHLLLPVSAEDGPSGAALWSGLVVSL